MRSKSTRLRATYGTLTVGSSSAPIWVPFVTEAANSERVAIHYSDSPSVYSEFRLFITDDIFTRVNDCAMGDRYGPRPTTGRLPARPAWL